MRSWGISSKRQTEHRAVYSARKGINLPMVRMRTGGRQDLFALRKAVSSCTKQDGCPVPVGISVAAVSLQTASARWGLPQAVSPAFVPLRNFCSAVGIIFAQPSLDTHRTSDFRP